MAAPILVVDASRPDPVAIAEAARVIRAGGIVAIPTETVYGLAANALDPGAVSRIFSAKGRPAFNPLIVHVADASEVTAVARDIPPLAWALAERFWPGPLTLVMQRQPVVPDAVTAGLPTVGVRVPAHAVMRAVIREAGVPLAAPSANLFTRVSPTTAAHVVAQLGDRVDLVLDAGPAAVGIESTVLDLTTTPPRLLRPGGVTREALEALTGALAGPTAFGASEARPSPGLVERHYAPRTTLELFDPGAREAVLARAAVLHAEGRRATVVLRGTSTPGAPYVLRMPDDAVQYARALYGMLHELEERGGEVAWVEDVPAAPTWDAIRDRLRRASTPPP